MRRPLVFSILLHIAVLAFFISRKKNTPLEAGQSHANPGKTLKFRSVTPEELAKEMRKALPPENLIAQTDDRLKSAAAPKTKERIFLSKTNQVVDHNTRAAKIGTFKNVLKEGVTESQANTQSKSESSPLLKKLMSLAPNPKDLEQQQALTAKTGHLRAPASLAPHSEAQGPKGDGLSASDDYLEDVAIGANTLLNAKEFVFYSFYERIRERLRNEWQPRLNDEINSIINSGQHFIGDHKTQVIVSLDERGQLTALTVLASSGFSELDRAATEAFKMAAPFPNPPQGMFEKDRSVKIRWDFVVVADGSDGPDLDIKRKPAGFP